ncbi:MAG: polysaccharide biosynthesis/export family protein [Gemmatimonadaceae bacterium]|nr:polysaccharide biosynthesis/export family protein [Gemmatimonadaceae bacterium]
MTRFMRSLICLMAAFFSIAASNSGVQAQNFALRPGDAVRVYVPRDTSLSGTFDVDPQSVLTLPLVGRVDVAGKPWNQVSVQLMAAFRRELREPGITLTPLRRVLVLGAVNKPGSYLIEPAVTLAGAIAEAEGALADATVRRVRVTRGGSVIQADASRGLEIADMPVESGDQIFVLQRNWFARNSNFLITALLSLTGIVATLALR